MKNNKVKGIYIHVPFCKHICTYCDFCKVFYTYAGATSYVEKVVEDLKKIDYKVESIYIGGGSPSSLDEYQLNKLLKEAKLHLIDDGEFCIELNPEDMDERKVKVLSQNGVNRVSMGVQTINTRLLQLLGRFHDANKVENVVNMLKKEGIYNINLDLMYGLPLQKIQDIRETLDFFMKLDVNHISTYALMIEEHTYFYIKNVNALDDDIQADQYKFICDYLKEKGFIHYEISNFAKKGYESKQNLIYWHDEEYIGIGVGSSGYENGIRYDHTRNIKDYVNGNLKREEHKIEGDEEEYEYIMLNLRLKEGINFFDYKQKFGFDFKEKYKKEIDILLENDDISITENNIAIKEEKFFISNKIISIILNNLEY